MTVRGYEKLNLNPTVITAAVKAYAYEKDIDPQDITSSDLKAIDSAIRAAIERGRGYGWFDPNSPNRNQFGKVRPSQCYKVHMFEGTENQKTLPTSRYGLHAIKVGQTHKIEIDENLLPRLRAAATSYAKDHGLKFSVRKVTGGAHITRLM